MRDNFEDAWAKLREALAVAEAAASSVEQRTMVRHVRHALEHSDLVGALAHDIKDPLASIMMGLSTVQKTEGPHRTILVNAGIAARRLDRIVDNVRRLETIRRGEYTPRLRVFPLGSVLVEMIAQSRAIPVELDAGADTVRIRAMGDAFATTRILEELLDNAVGFSPPNGRVRVVLAVADPHVSVSIFDEGRGIDDAHLPHVFDETKNRQHQPRRGPGRGLPLAAALASVQNGDVAVERNTPTGTIATLRLRAA